MNAIAKRSAAARETASEIWARMPADVRERVRRAADHVAAASIARCYGATGDTDLIGRQLYRMARA